MINILFYFRAAIIIVRTFLYRLFVFGITVKISQIGHNVFLRGKVKLSNGDKIKDNVSISGDVIIGANTLINTNVEISSYANIIKIGSDCSISRNTVIRGKITMGDKILIGPNCVIVGGNHNISDPTRNIADCGGVIKGITIESDVWIGGNASVVDGVTIGRGSVIGAGSVVTKSIPPYSIAVGSPAVVIKSRK